MTSAAHEIAAAFGRLEGVFFFSFFLVYTLPLSFIDARREYPIDGTRVPYIHNKPSCINSFTGLPLVWLMNGLIFHI